jgi:DnaJ-class molecular chaperone
MTDHYSTLGVAKTASADEIKRAYRRLASQHHPDKGGDVKKFQEIEQAYRVLSDPQQREQYDNPSPFGQFNFNQNSPGQGFDFDTIFDIFGTRFRQQRPQYVRCSLTISLEDSARGGRRQVSVATHAGSNTIEIEIPVGINDGDNIQYQGVAPGGLDLIVIFRVLPDNRWHRQNDTLICERHLSVWDLILGTDVQINDILDNQLVLTIPPGTQPGTVMRMRGCGMPSRMGNRGDLLVRIHAHIPQTINPAILDAIKQHRN